MPRANYFASGNTDGLNTAVYRFLRTRKGNTGAAAQTGQSPELVNRKQINIKIDEQVSKSHRLNVGWSYQLDDSADNLANWPNSIQGESRRRPLVLTMNLTSTLSSTLLNEARFGLSKDKIEVVPAWYSTNDSVRKEAEAWLIQGGAGSNGTPLKVAFTPGTGSFAFGTGVINYGSTYSGSDSPLYNFADTVSWTHRAHAFRAGAEIRLTRSTDGRAPFSPRRRAAMGPTLQQI
jgi:hypothetical protein